MYYGFIVGYLWGRLWGKRIENCINIKKEPKTGSKSHIYAKRV